MELTLRTRPLQGRALESRKARRILPFDLRCWRRRRATRRRSRSGAPPIAGVAGRSGSGTSQTIKAAAARSGARGRCVAPGQVFRRSAQIADQPAAGAAQRAAALAHDIDRRLDGRPVGEDEPFQPSGGDVLLDHVPGHVAPAEAGEQKLQPGAEIGETPDMGADHAGLHVLRHRGAVGQHELDMRFERLARDRLGGAGERMAGGDHRDQRDAG